MNFHSILHRELLRTAKRPASYYLRSGLGAMALAAATGVIYATFHGFGSVVMTGRNLLFILAAMGLLWALFEGILLTVDSIARERRDGTLGLLFLSNLTGYDIVIGKAGAAGLRTLFGLMAAAPAPALTFLFGGVSLGDYAQMAAGLLNALLFALGLGLFLSARDGSRRRNEGIAGLLLVWFGVGAPVCALILEQKYSAHALSLLIGASPVTPLAHLLQKNGAGLTLGSLALSHAMAWGFLAAAGWRLDKSWQSAPSSRPVKARRGLLSVGALALIGAAATLVFFPKAAPAVWATELFVLHAVLSFEVSVRASKALSEDRRSGVLEILLTTPLPEEEIVRRHLLAVKRFAARAFARLAAGGVCLLTLIACTAQPGEFAMWLLAYLLSLFSFALDLWWQARVGLWRGLRTANSAKAARQTFGALILILILSGMIGLAMGATVVNRNAGDAALCAAGAASISFFGLALGMFTAATTGLSQRMREIASEGNN